MKNDVKSFIGVGLIDFGAKRNFLRKIVNENYNVIRRNEYALNTSDYYKELGFFIEFTKENRCEAVEFTDKSNLIYNGQDLFLLKFSSLKEIYKKVSKNIEEEDNLGVTYHDLGFGATCEYGTDKIESIIVFSKDYW